MICRRFAFCFAPFALFVWASVAWASASDIKSTTKTDNGGRIVLYTDGSKGCYDKNDRPAKGAGCKTTFKTDDGGRIEFYMDGEIDCYDKNDRPFAGPICKDAVGENALLLKAGQLEREGNDSMAKRYYETIIRLHPNSQAAVRSNDRLLQLSDSDKAAERQRRNVEELRGVAEQNKRTEDAQFEQARQQKDAQFAQAREDAERQQEQARDQQRRNCAAGFSQCMAMCAGMRSKEQSFLEVTPKEKCEKECNYGRRACN